MRATAGPQEATGHRQSGSPIPDLSPSLNTLTAFTIDRPNPLI